MTGNWVRGDKVMLDGDPSAGPSFVGSCLEASFESFAMFCKGSLRLFAPSERSVMPDRTAVNLSLDSSGPFGLATTSLTDVSTNLLGVTEKGLSTRNVWFSRPGLTICSLEPGMGAIDELGPDCGSAIVEADPCATLRSTIRLWPPGVANGLVGRERLETCLCIGWCC